MTATERGVLQNTVRLYLDDEELLEEAKEVMGYQDSKLDLTPEDVVQGRG